MWWGDAREEHSSDLTLGQKIDLGRVQRRRLTSSKNVSRIFQGVLSVLLLAAISSVTVQYWSRSTASRPTEPLRTVVSTSHQKDPPQDATTSGPTLTSAVESSLKLSADAEASLYTSKDKQTEILDFLSETSKSTGTALSHTDAEKLYRTIPSASRSYEHLAVLTSLPHIAGTAEDHETALFVKRTFESFGLDSHITTHKVLMSYPINSSIELVAPTSYVAFNREEVLPEDLTSGDDRSFTTKPYNCYSGNGDVTAELIYANYGLEEDFALLEKAGVNVTDKIVIFRYGATFRGNKAWQAQRRGAAGVIIYSDPADDGYGKGEVYPKGPWRPDHSVQRGGVGFPSICEGSPDESRLEVCGVESVYDLRPKIPVHPIAYRDAEPLLRALGGKEAPKEFQGGLNFTYHLGPGPAQVRLYVHNEFKMTPIWNVFATIRGSSAEEEEGKGEGEKLVILGNHRDAWTFGAVDPNSGTAALLEIARGLGELLKTGWKPRRTIILANWDGEEPNLLGSTAWVEQHAKELKKKTVAYLNVDCGVSGPHYFTAATPQLSELVKNVSLDTVDPDDGGKVWKPWMDSKYPRRLGGGSDFEGFLNHIGIPAVDMGYSFLPEGGYPVYHSNFDSISWMTKFGDPDFKHFPVVAQIWGVLGLRLADEEIIPFNYSNYADELLEGLHLIEGLIEKHPKASELNLSKLKDSIADFSDAAKAINSEIIAFRKAEGGKQSAELRQRRAASLNHRLMYTERAFITPEGLPGRKWYKHVLVDNAKTLGYGYDLFPGVAQAIRDDDLETGKQQLEIATRCVQKAAAVLRGQSVIV